MKVKKVVTPHEYIRCKHPITTLAELHLFLGRWDITEDWEEVYNEPITGNKVFVYKEQPNE